MTPTILLGIDGAAFSILDPLMADGTMPALRALISEGTRAELLSTPHPLTPPAWTTVITGQSPGRHGIFDFIWAEERRDNVYFTLNNFRDIRAETVWSMVSRAGGRFTTLNFPLMSPPPVLDGVIVPGLVSWKHLRRNVYPPEIYPKLQALPGFNPREVAWDFEREKKATKIIPEQEREEWVTFHIRRDQHWFEMFRYLHKHHRADLTAILIDGVDKLQHICWKYLDPNHIPADPTAEDEKIRRLCLDYFRQLDSFIGQVAELAGDEGRIFIVSDHGFGPTEKVFRLNKWLEENGYLTWAQTDTLGADEQKKVDRLVNEHFVHLDWAKTTAYAQSGAANGIHIRVAGESNMGGGIPRERYETFRERMIEQLLAIRDPEDGTRIVTKVMKKEEVFPGPHNERCPDLTLMLHDYGFVSTLNKEPVCWCRPEVAGTHQPEGILIARGSGIPAGARIEQQSILNVTPTLLHSLGLPLPADLEGQVMEAVFEPSHLADNPVIRGEPSEVPDSYATKTKGTLPDKKEEKMILEHLRALGYVE